MKEYVKPNIDISAFRFVSDVMDLSNVNGGDPTLPIVPAENTGE